MDREIWLHRLAERLEQLRSQTDEMHGTVINSSDLDEMFTVVEELTIADEEADSRDAELTAARDSLDLERLRYLELFDFAPDPYFLTDAHGVVAEANRAAAALLRVNRRFLLGKPLQVFIPNDERLDFRIRINDLQQMTRPLEWRLRIVPRGGSPIDVGAAVAIVRDRAGAFGGLRWSIRDITARVREERQLRDLNAELERRVAARTADLEAANQAKDDLLRRERNAREAAEVANRVKEDFLATLSHELRTPLNVVLGWTFRLRSGTLDDAQHKKALAIIERNAHEQSRLVEDLLDTARIASGRVQLQMQVVELAQIVRGAVDAVEATADARGVRLAASLAGGLIVRGDPERIRQIAWNLLLNAVKFTPEGGDVSIATVRDDGRASIVVRDTGVGIEPDVISHIFERFWQAERSVSRTTGGLGLGLAIVKHLTEMHGGEVEAFSEGAGTGATFRVLLPLLDGTKALVGAESKSD